MLQSLMALAVSAAALSAPSLAQPAPAEPAAPTPAETAAIADRLAPSLVRIEITPQYDKGESPGNGRYSGWRAPGRNAGDDAASSPWEGWDQLIREERPAEGGGFLVAPTRVYTADPQLHPRFIKSIIVRFGDAAVPAKLAALPRIGSGVFLELDAPLAGTTPLNFDPARPDPQFAAAFDKRDAAWITRLGGLRTAVGVTSDGRRFVAAGPGTLVLDRSGGPLTIADLGSLPVDGSWKMAPADWDLVNSVELATAIQAVERGSAQHLLRVTLNFRSPRAGPEAGGWGGRRQGQDEDAEITEWNGLGVAIDEGTVVVLANFTPKVTARLERIRLFAPGEEELTASFAGTLKDWGAFVARLDKPLSSPARWSTSPITGQRDRLLIEAAATVRGETRTIYFSHARIHGFYTGWKGQTFPQADTGGSDYSAGSADYQNFLYGLDGTLIAMPMERRQKVTTRERYSYADSRSVMTPIAMLTGVVGEGATALDAENRPLTEQEEHRLAWLGVEMQSMDPDLARANDVMDQTNGGASGGIVTFVYPGSPATQAGLREGDIVLRLHIEGQPKPLEVTMEEFPGFPMMEQFWEAIDRVPEEYLDRMPRPWGTAETSLTRALTDVGFGTPFVADVWRDGKIIQLPMQVTQGPAHYDAAARFKSEPAGLTVRDLTYEVRRFLQLKPDEPGVIISRVERGGKAGVAGIKPFETIVSINDQPVNNVKDFERLIGTGGELKIAVKRMTQGRTVKIKIEPNDSGEDDATVSNEP